MKDNLYKVVAAGIANSGKSSVLSAIAGQRGLFPDGDVPRMTKTIKRQELNGLLLVDTPGLDADDTDTQKQMYELMTADTLLWCHNLRKGELGHVEVSALKQYAKDGGAIWRTCFVLTHGDDMASWESICTVSATIAKQLHEIFNLHFIGLGEHIGKTTERRPRPFDLVKVWRFWKGIESVTSKQDFLIRTSGIPALKQFLYELATKKRGPITSAPGRTPLR